MDDYLLAVGRGLRAWSSVENAMFDLFVQVSGSPQDRSLRIFDAVNSFDARLNILNELMLLELHDHPDKPVWIKLAVKLGKFYKKRHELAHFDIVVSHKGLPDGGTEIIHHFQPFFTMRKFLLHEPKYLKLSEIQDRTARFNQIQLAVR